MKKKRQQAIIELITKQPVETQEELTSLLNDQGFSTTQATVSRDIRELELTKIPLPDGRQAYIRAFKCQGKRGGKVLSENFK